MKKVLTLLFVTLMLAPFALVANGQQEAAAAPVVATVDTVEEAVLDYFANLPAHSNIIKSEDVFAKINAGEDILILDIRMADAYAAGHLKGAVNLPWGTAALADAVTSIPQDKEVFVNCYSGQTAGQATMLLKFAGVNARSIKYGWNLGISKTEGIDAVTETAVNELPAGDYDVDSAIAAAYKAYYAAFADVKGTPFASNIISSENAKKILDAKDAGVQFVSIRSAEDYGKGHIETAVNVPWGKGMQELFDSLPADKKLIVNCYSGQTAGQTVAALRLLGFDAVSLKSGMGTPVTAPTGWANEGFPVVQ